MTVLNLVNSFAVGEVVNFCIFIGHAVSFEHHTSIQLYAGVRSANAYAFALQIGELSDAAVFSGNDLANVRPQTHHSAKVFCFRFALICAKGFNSLDNGVAHGNSHFTLASQNSVDVFCSCTGRSCRGLVAHFTNNLGEGTANREVNTTGGAGQYSDEFLAAVYLTSCSLIVGLFVSATAAGSHSQGHNDHHH